jgi:hypothetical protein
MENCHLSALPLDIIGTGNSSRDAGSHICYT